MRRKHSAEQATSSITFPVLLVDQANDQGAVADLTLTLQQGSGQLIPSPEQTEFSREPSFLAAEANAQQVISLPKEWDVLWRLVRRDGKPILRLTGGSLGAAFAIGSAKLLAINGIEVPRQDRTTLIKLNLSQVAISAQNKSDSALATVGGITYKLEAAVLSEFSPRIHTVVVARGQEIKSGEPDSRLHLLCAGTLSEAIALIHSDYQSGWGEIIDCSDALGEPVEIQGQGTLKNELEAFLAERKSGYFLVVGGEGSGKSVFVADAVRKDPTAVYHLIQSEDSWDDPDAITKSLMNQLRRKHGVDVEGETLYDVLNKVGRTWTGESREKEVLLWVDGLDRIYGPEGQYPDRSLSDLLPVKLPEGVFIVLTSRPGAHLDALADPEVCKRVRLGKETSEEKYGPRERAHQDVVDVLGLLAAGQEPLSLEDLAAFFGQVLADQMKEVITFAQEFFSGGATSDPQSPLQFYHTSFREFLLDEAKERREMFHRALAEAGEQWQKYSGHSREYVLRRLPTHQREARMWDPLCKTLTDFDFLQAKIGAMAGGVEPPPHTVFDLLKDFQTSLEGKAALPEGHRRMDEVRALHRVIDLNSHLLKKDPSLLVQQLYNPLICDWGEETGMGGRLRLAAKQYRRPWLKSMKCPFPGVDPALRRILEGHSDRVSSVAFSPDGKRVASGSGDRTVRLWDAKSGALEQVLEGHSEGVNSVAFSPDGMRVASGSWDRTVRLWDAESGTLEQVLEGHNFGVHAVAFSPDGERVASGSWDQTVRLWDAESGTLEQVLEGHSDKVSSVAFSADGMRVASGSWDRTVRLWDAARGTLEQVLEGHSDKVSSVAFSPDGKRVASGSYDRTVRLWDAESGALEQVLKGHSGWVESVAFSPDGKRVAGGNGDGTVRLWDAESGALEQVLKGHSGWFYSVAFSPDGKRVASGSDDRTVRLWDAESGALEQVLEGHSDMVRSVAFSPDGKRVASWNGDGTVRLWDAESGALEQVLEGHSGHSRWAESVAFSPDGKRVASGTDDGTVRLWDAESGALEQVLEGRSGHSGWVESVAFSPDGKRVASGSYDRTVRLWDAESGALEQVLKGHSGWVSSVAFSRDGKRVASGTGDGTVRLWDAESGALEQELKGHSGWVSSVAFSPDGKRVASGSDDRTVRLWDAESGALEQELKGHSERVRSVAFSPDGKRVASGSDDRTVRIWDAESGKEIALMSCMDKVLAVSFPPRLRRLRVGDGGGGTGRPNVYILEIFDP